MKIDFKDKIIRYWTASLALIAAGLAGWTPGFYLVTALGLVQIVHFAAAKGSWTAFAVQVRIGFTLMAVLFLWEPLRVCYWLPLVGLTARVTLNYCLLARVVSLLPWNRQEPLTWTLVKKRIFSKPVSGAIVA